MKAGVFWTTDTDGRALPIEYYTDTAPAENFADLVWARAFARAANLAPELVFIADGVHWIWRIFERHFPQAIQIVDFYHASTYLAQVARVAFGEDTLAAATWLETHARLLHDGRLSTLIRACQMLSDRAPAAVAHVRRYFAANRSRLRYGKFRALGLQIGSGTMESGCKQIGLERLKIAGAHWSPYGAGRVAKARAAFLSHQITWSHSSLPHVA